MTQTSKSCKFLAGITWPRRALPCLVPVPTFRTLLRALLAQKIFRKRRLFNAAATSNIGPVRDAGNPAHAIGSSHASSTTWGTWFPPDRVTSILSTRNITAPSAASTSRRTPRNMLCPNPTIPIVSLPWRCDSSWRTACPIKSPAGICGAIIGFLSLSPPSKTGWRPGGKKGGPPNVDDLSRLGPGGFFRVYRGR